MTPDPAPPRPAAAAPTAAAPTAAAAAVEQRYGARMWRGVAHLLADLPVGVLGFTYAVTSLALGIGLAVTVVGIPLLAGGLYGCRGLARLERGRVRGLLGERIADAPPLTGVRPGPAGWVVAALTDGLGWRSALYFMLMLPWGVVAFTLTLVCLVVGWPVLPWVVRGLTAVDRALACALLCPSALTARVRELEDDRGTVVDTAAADLRRIERDLHDGAQARLVALAMDLGLAREKLRDDPEAAARMVDAAHGEVKVALQELRDLARGIHPAVLTDRGLDAALSSVAARTAVPGGVRVSVDLAGADGTAAGGTTVDGTAVDGTAARPDSAVEGIAYFTVTELLTNTSKHAGARSAAVDVWRSGDRLMLQVTDDGRGGAVAQPGGGLAGLADRVRAVDGVFVVDSPVGGPTTVTVELPWRTKGAARRGV